MSLPKQEVKMLLWLIKTNNFFAKNHSHVKVLLDYDKSFHRDKQTKRIKNHLTPT